MFYVYKNIIEFLFIFYFIYFVFILYSESVVWWVEFLLFIVKDSRSIKGIGYFSIVIKHH